MLDSNAPPSALVCTTSPSLSTALVEILSSKGWRVAVSSAFASDEEHQACLKMVETELGNLDLLAVELPADHPTSFDVFKATEKTIESELERCVSVPFFLTQAVARWMLAHQRPESSYRRRIIYLAPAADFCGPLPVRDGCITSATADMLTKLWGVRLAEDSIDVYAVRRSRPDQRDQDPLVQDQRLAKATADLACGEFTYTTGSALTVA